jgi:hypothetical protein
MRLGESMCRLRPFLSEYSDRLNLQRAERLLNEKWLVNQPEAVLLALAQMTRQSPDDHVSARLIFTIFTHG